VFEPSIAAATTQANNASGFADAAEGFRNEAETFKNQAGEISASGLDVVVNNGVVHVDGVGGLTSSAGLTFDGTNLGTTGTMTAAKLIPTGTSATGNGMYLPAANTLGWSVNGAEAMRLTSTGLVIGTTVIASGGGGGLTLGDTTTGKSLHVYSSSYGNNGAANFYGTDNGMKLQMGALSSTRGYIFANTGCDIELFTNGTSRALLDSSGNLGLGGTSFADGAVVMFIANATTAPTTNPTGGGLLYVEGGALKYRGSSGTVTTIANA
jgi:hypothetical protein